MPVSSFPMNRTQNKHVNIPIFLPETACPNRCVYCNQFLITGQKQLPDNNFIKNIIDTHLATINAETTLTEVAFFGGNFTGLDLITQKGLLDLVKPYKEAGRVQGIRISTRPDYISTENIAFLKEQGVSAIELGIQSFDDNVLKQSGRGYTAHEAETAALLIKAKGFELGLQMMTGLPGDSEAASIATAKKIFECGADTTRIYPLIVIKDTPLEQMYHEGKYQPPSLDDTIRLVATLYKLFFEAGVKVLKMGLHPGGELMGGAIVAGPYHPSFAELVLSHIWGDIFLKLQPDSHAHIRIDVPKASLNHAAGFAGSNRKTLETLFRRVSFYPVTHLKPFEYDVHYC